MSVVRAVLRAVVLDLDGVLRHFPADVEAGLCAAAGLPAGTVLATAFAPDRLGPAVTGAVTDEAWRSAVAADLAREHGLRAPAAQALVDGWSASPGVVDAEVLHLVASLRRSGVPVVLLTNATTRLPTDLAAPGLDTAVDAVVSSADLGATKPDERAFAAARAEAERLVGGPVAGCELLLVDDSVANVRAAAALGWRTHHFAGVTGVAGLARALEPS